MPHRSTRHEYRKEAYELLTTILKGPDQLPTNELRLENMPALIKAVESLVIAATLEDAVAQLSTFNEAQIDDERTKAQFLSAHPHLADIVFGLEDNRLLRGSLMAFDLDAGRLPARAACFEKLMGNRRLWPALTAALLATGDYSRHPNSRSFRFGSPEDDRWWRELLTGTKRSNIQGTSTVLADLLDQVSEGGRDPAHALLEIRNAWMSGQDSFDWRYYLARYDAMREGKSGIYVAEGERMGFQLCMLDKTQLNSWYRDPFLLAVWRASGVKGAVRDPWFMGYETGPRWLTLNASGTKVRCVDAGFRLQPPLEASHLEAYNGVRKAFNIGDDHLLRVPQTPRAGRSVDTENRVELGAKLLMELVAAGL